MTEQEKEPATRRAMTRFLLVCGVIGPLLFIVVLLIAGAIRPNYNAWYLPGSSLSLGNEGWVQIVNFIVCGVLVLSFSIGLRRVLVSGKGATWGPLLLGLFGLGLIGAGVFVTDPVFGYPPGTPSNVQTLHGTIHTCCGVFCFSVLAATMFVLARRFAGAPRWKGWTLSTIAAGILVIGFFVAYLAASVFNALPHGTLADAPVGLFQRLAIVIDWGWVALLALQFLKQKKRGSFLDY